MTLINGSLPIAWMRVADALVSLIGVPVDMLGRRRRLLQGTGFS